MYQKLKKEVSLACEHGEFWLMVKESIAMLQPYDPLRHIITNEDQAITKLVV